MSNKIPFRAPHFAVTINSLLMGEMKEVAILFVTTSQTLMEQ